MVGDGGGCCRRLARPRAVEHLVSRGAPLTALRGKVQGVWPVTNRVAAACLTRFTIASTHTGTYGGVQPFDTGQSR
jgi:hypothetical protein